MRGGAALIISGVASVSYAQAHRLRETQADASVNPTLQPASHPQRAVIFHARWILPLRAKSGSTVCWVISSTA